MFKKAISLILSHSLILTQPIFAQGVAELNIGKYLNQMSALNTDSFRPPHLRYISYDIKSNDFKLLLDQGDFEKSPGHQVTRSPEKSENALKNETKKLFNYFLIGLSLPNDKFWVNLRPDAPEQIIDPELEKTDMGKIMLEADLQLKKDTAGWTSPQTPEGKEYWDKLYKRAGELFGTENITIPTITRPWIVPGEVIIRESEDSSYIYKANLKVMLEEDYIKSRQDTMSPGHQYNFNDQRMKKLNQYSTQLIRELILPKLTQEVNTSKKYAQLRQVFFSLILSRWFKDKFRGQPGQYSSLIDSHNLDNLISKEAWTKDYYFSEYKKSFQQGEYNLKEQITTPTGQVIRSYVSGGTDMTGNSKPLIEGGFKAGSPLLTKMKKSTLVGLAILIVSGAFVGGSIHNHLSEPTGIIESQERLNAIASANHGFLIDLEKIAREGNGEGVEFAYIGWKINLKRAFSDLNREQRKKVVEALNNTIESLSRTYANDKKLINVFNEAQEYLEKEKETGSSPLTVEETKKTIKDQLTLLSRSYKDHPKWREIFNGYFHYADLRIEKDKDLDVLNSAISNLVKDVGKITDPELKSALKPLVDGFKNLSKAAANKLGLLKSDEVSSALTQDLSQNSNSPLTTGGIDFTRINYLTRPMGSFQGLDLRLPLLSKAELEGIDISREMAAMEQMINAKIEVSTDRLKRLLAAMSQKDAFNAQREIQLLPLLLRLCWLKEERGVETTPDFRAVLLIADTGLFVEQGKERYSPN
ncbi:MAG: hypothetical protein Q7J72_09795 [Candidatus Omnitrophota bacterium]|nr:hypothetical protein [Candidatus Omnitrophota bacterium]